MAIISRTLIDEYDGHGFAAQYSKYANNAKNDENNNPIAETYATKDELNHVAPSGATPTSSLTCTGDDTFAWAGWTQASIPIPPPVKKYLGIAYRGYSEGVSIYPTNANIDSRLAFTDYENLNSWHVFTQGYPDSPSQCKTPEILNLWNQNKSFTVEYLLYGDDLRDSCGITWGSPGYSGGGTYYPTFNIKFMVGIGFSSIKIHKDSTFSSYHIIHTINTNISRNKWHHVAVTYDSLSTICTIYIDGISLGQYTISGSHNTASNFLIHSNSPITQVAVYDYVAYKDNFTVPTIPHIYNDEYMLKAQ